jgi:hypothetical protein
MSSCEQLSQTLKRDGFARRDGGEIMACLGQPISDWLSFAKSWADLDVDAYMGDGGRYRRRRYAVFEVDQGWIRRLAHQPHYQAKVYNRLNGGLERWFEPVREAVGQSPLLHSLLLKLSKLFDSQLEGPAPHTWHVEVHQFRIEASASAAGQPTPEGAHRDGVDFAFVMMIGRKNVASGVTEIFDADRQPLGSFTLADPGDAVFLDDHRIFHGVTPIVPSDPKQAAIRDVLVVTFTRVPAPG